MLYFKVNTLDPLVKSFPEEFDKETLPHVADLFKVYKHSDSSWCNEVRFILAAFNDPHKQQVLISGYWAMLLGVGGWIKITKGPDRQYTVTASSEQIFALVRALFSDNELTFG